MATHATNHGQGGGAATPSGRNRTHLSVAGLRARGWTAGMVRQLLGKPDLLRTNPYFRTAPRTRLYRVERIAAAERSDEFRIAAAEPVDVPRLTPERLAAAAVEHHRSRRDRERAYGASDQVPDPATVEHTEPGALARWKVNYLRHGLTRYDELLDGLYASTGRAVAEELLRRKVYAAIAEAYPDLARECERQLREEEFGPPPA